MLKTSLNVSDFESVTSLKNPPELLPESLFVVSVSELLPQPPNREMERVSVNNAKIFLFKTITSFLKIILNKNNFTPN